MSNQKFHEWLIEGNEGTSLDILVVVNQMDANTLFQFGSDDIDIAGYLVADVATDLLLVDGSAIVDLAALIAAADAHFDLLGGANGGDQVYAAYNALGTGNTYILADTDASGSFDAGDVSIVLTGINTATEIVAADFI